MKTPADWERVRELFHRALALPAEERARFLQRETSGDDATRREIESLLAAHADADGFLSNSPVASAGGDDPPPVIDTLRSGTRLSAFEILGPLGAGGMGEVHRARDTRLDREVAIKVLSRDLADDPGGRDRFEREARAVSRLTHPHICTLYDIGSAEISGRDVRFLVMELLDGETLADRLRRGALPIRQAIQVAIEILDALTAAHAAGIIHRDLKPANIMLTKSGVKLLDFGLARLPPAPAAGHATATLGKDSLTAPGVLFGTMPYMAPEQVRGTEADARTDLFAFGAVFYEMLTGRRAFSAPSQPALIAAILEQDPAPLTVEQPLVTPALDGLVRACLAKDPAERWQHARDVGLALRGLEEGRPPSSPRYSGDASTVPHKASRVPGHWRLHAAWSAVVIVGALLAWLLPRSPAEPAVAKNPQPVIVLMDSPLQGRVYDPRTFAAGGTNADDITDALRGLPIVTHKETTSPMWHREEEVRQQNPDLIISHLSCLYDQRVTSEAPVRTHLFNMSEDRLTAFFAYAASVNPHTKFLVYSRGRFGTDEKTWIGNVVARFPQLTGRLFTMVVPGGEAATFRDPAIMKNLHARVVELLSLHETVR
jgi:serine/threonine protein kinase